ncbi:MAG: phosphotransferase [Thermomicrobiales bacterium]
MNWTDHRMVGGGEGLGVWRLAGNARIGEQLQPWSIILKGWPSPEPGIVPSAWNAPHRERELYRSGLLTNLSGGFRVPTCYGDIERPDGSVWLWLEDIKDGAANPWKIETYAMVGRQLGQMNGAYLAERALPESPCLSRGWLRGWVEAAAPAMANLAKEVNHPFVRRVYPPHVADAYTRLWDKRRAYSALLETLPQTFAHLDAFRRNLFIRGGLDGIDETVLIDWGFAGIAAVGEELAALIIGSVAFMDVPIAEAQHLQNVVLEKYLEGLGDMGWHGDPDLVRTGYAIAAGLRYGIGAMRLELPFLLDEELHPHIEQLFGRPLTEIVANQVELHAFLAKLVQDIPRTPPSLQQT